jgi:hypothetical protein
MNGHVPLRLLLRVAAMHFYAKEFNMKRRWLEAGGRLERQNREVVLAEVAAF